MVVEGLLAAKVDRQRLVQSLQSLVRDYFDAETGGFRTVQTGRASYWQGVSTETTAHVAYLMQRVDPRAFAREIEQARNFVVKHQASDGHWDGRWFPSQVLPTFHAVRLLAALGNQDAALSRAAQFMLRLQRADGSFAGRTIETSLAVLALTATGKQDAAVERARSWLRARSTDEACAAGEPFLYYWFEPDQQTRLFFSCIDRGPIARAWIKLALLP
jgi:squalene cyclase